MSLVLISEIEHLHLWSHNTLMRKKLLVRQQFVDFSKYSQEPFYCNKIGVFDAFEIKTETIELPDS